MADLPALRRRRAFAVAAASLACAFFLAHGALADGSLTLEWRAPAECPDGKTVEREVSRLLGGAPAARPFTAVAEVTHEDARWRVQLRTQSAENVGDRAIESETCGELADATALVLAMAIDPARVAATRASPVAPAADAGIDVLTTVNVIPPSTPATASTAPTAVPTAPPSSPPRPPPPRRTFAIGPYVLGDVGALPNPGVGPGLAFAWTPGALRLQLTGLFFPANTARLPFSRGGTFELYGAHAAGCYEVLVDVFEIGPCVGVEVGALKGTGFGINKQTPALAFWAAPSVGGAFAWRIGSSFALRLELAALFPLQRPEFVLDGVGGVHRPAAVLGRAGLGAEVRF
jgi:hypothetical protein